MERLIFFLFKIFGTLTLYLFEVPQKHFIVKLSKGRRIIY